MDRPAVGGVAEAVAALILAAAILRRSRHQGESDTREWLSKVLRGAADDQFVSGLCQEVERVLEVGVLRVMNQDGAVAARVAHARLADRDILRSTLVVAVRRAIPDLPAGMSVDASGVAGVLASWGAVPEDETVASIVCADTGVPDAAVDGETPPHRDG